MTITTTELARAAGLAAVAGGLLFLAVQFKHPILNATFASTSEYAVRETMKIFMAVLSTIPITTPPPRHPATPPPRHPANHRRLAR